MKNFNHKIQLLTAFLCVMVLCLAGCVKEEAASAGPGEEAILSLSVVASEPFTKSAVTVADTRISNVIVAAYTVEGGILERVAFSAGSSVSINLDRGRGYRLLFLANLPDDVGNLFGSGLSLRDSGTGNGIADYIYSCWNYYSDHDAWTFNVPDTAQINDNGLPMAGELVISAGWPNSRTVSLRSLMAKVEFIVDDGTTGELGGSLGGLTAVIRQAATTLSPFTTSGRSMATSVADGETVVMGSDRSAVFYVSENCQGTADGVATTADKNPFVLGPDKAELATYIELTATKGGRDGVTGDALYRFYLGEDALSSLDLVGNRFYHVTAKLTWEGMYVEDWTLTWDGFEDGRFLKWIAPATALFSPGGKLMKGSPAQSAVSLIAGGGSATVAYAYFERLASVGRIINGCFSPGSYPYGWYLTIDGETASLGVGAAGTLPNGLVWQYDDTDDSFTMYAPGSCESTPDGSNGTEFRMVSFDGRVQSDVMYVKILAEPVEAEWQGGLAPVWAGQAAYLTAKNANTGVTYTSDVEYEVVSGSEFVELGTVTGGKVLVSSLKPGSAVIRVTNTATGSTCDQSLTVGAPFLRFASASYAVGMDGSLSDFRVGYYTASSGGTLFSPVSTVTATGTSLLSSALTGFLRPVVTVEPHASTAWLSVGSTIGSYDSGKGCKGSVWVSCLHDGDDEIPYSDTGTALGTMTAASATDGCGVSTTADVYPVDPFSNFTASPITLEDVNDYSLLSDYNYFNDRQETTEHIDTRLNNVYLRGVREGNLSVCMYTDGISESGGGLDGGITVNTSQTSSMSGESTIYSSCLTRFGYRLHNPATHLAGPVEVRFKVKNPQAGGDCLFRTVGTFNKYVHAAIGAKLVNVTQSESCYMYSVTTDFISGLSGTPFQALTGVSGLGCLQTSISNDYGNISLQNVSVASYQAGYFNVGTGTIAYRIKTSTPLLTGEDVNYDAVYQNSQPYIQFRNYNLNGNIGSFRVDSGREFACYQPVGAAADGNGNGYYKVWNLGAITPLMSYHTGWLL